MDSNLKRKIEQAKRRVITTPRQALIWILRFINEIAIDNLPEKDWEKIQVEITVFSFYFPQFQRGACFLSINSRSFFESIPNDQYPRLPSKKEATKYQSDAQNIFYTFQNSKFTAQSSPLTFDNVFEEKIPMVFSAKFQVIQGKQSAIFTAWIKDRRYLFRINLILVLGQFMPNVKSCNACKRFFLTRRSNQMFCSNRCATRVMQRRKRNTPPSRYGKPGRPKAIKNNG